MARPEKVAQVEAVTAAFEGARSVVLNDFTGLDVAKLSELRRLCREAGVEFRVVKNTLAKRGLAGTPAEPLNVYLEGPTAIVVSRESENEGAKILAKFAEEHEAPRFKAGLVDGVVIDATEVLALAKLPSKEEMLSQVLAGVMGPARGLVSVMQAPLRDLLSVLSQIQKTEQSES